MTFFLLSRNCFIQSFVTGIRSVFIKVSKFIGSLGLNPKRVETEVVPIDECYKML